MRLACATPCAIHALQKPNYRIPQKGCGFGGTKQQQKSYLTFYEKD